MTATELPDGVVRRITVIGEDVLHRRCHPVTEFGTPELRQLIADMVVTLDVAEGVGLAANQIGVDLSVFIYDLTDDEGVRHVGHVCNPVLDELAPDQRHLVDSTEGCLSVPGPYKTVARPDYAVVRGQDIEGNQVVVEGHDYFARCLQHETDHLYGQLYVDRLTKRDRKDVLVEMEAVRDKVFERRAARAAELGLTTAD
jgi:peptide deformylase